MGTRGDVQPYVALGQGLQQAGHRVTIGAPDNFRSFIEKHGLEFVSLGSDFKSELSSKPMQDILEGGRTTWQIFKDYQAIRQQMADYHIKAYRLMWQAAQKADLLILQLLVLHAADFAEKLGIPVIYAGLQPITPTRDFPLIGSFMPNMGGFFNRLSYTALPTVNQIPHKAYNQLRKELLGLPSRSRFFSPLLERKNPIPTLYGFSKHLVTRPKDWPDSTKICGFWFLEEEYWQPDPKLQAFLENGKPPVYIGFSSIAWKAKHHTKIVVEAVKKWGGRAVIAKGWGGLDPEKYYDDLPDSIYVIDSAPHSKLFPLMGAIIHHGGAGSTGAALKAGKPTLICPDMVDQPFWSERVYSQGVGPEPILLAKLDAEILAARLKKLTETASYHEKATELARLVKQEQGIKQAIKAIHQITENFS